VLQLYMYIYINENIQELRNNSCSSKLTNYVLDSQPYSFRNIDCIPEIAGYVSLMKVSTRTLRRIVCVCVCKYIYVATKQAYRSTKHTDVHLNLFLVLCLAGNLVVSV